MLGVVYKTVNKISGKIYIGQTIRIDQKHYIGSGVAFKKAVKEFGRKNFVRNTIIECYSQEMLDEYEELFIELYSTTDPNIGYNISFGNINTWGEPNSEGKKENHPWLGKTHSEESRLKISDDCKRRIEEGIWINPFKGKKHTEENKKKQSERLKKSGHKPPSRLGLGHSEETRKRMSEYRKGNKPVNMRGVEAYNPETNEVLYKFTTIKEAMHFCKGDVSNTVRGRQQTAGGYHWRYTS